MGWGGYGIYDGDDTQTSHLFFLKKAGVIKTLEEASGWLGAIKTSVPKDRHSLLAKNVSKIKKMKLVKRWDDDKAIEWQMLLALFLDNKIRPPSEVIANGVEATKYLMGDHASSFDNPVTRRGVLRRFIARVEREFTSNVNLDAPKAKIQFTKEAIRKYLDAAIVAWRERKRTGDTELAPCYIDAFQSVRASIFGETLP